jgi:hypothetical protein
LVYSPLAHNTILSSFPIPVHVFARSIYFLTLKMEEIRPSEMARCHIELANAGIDQYFIPEIRNVISEGRNYLGDLGIEGDNINMIAVK